MMQIPFLGRLAISEYVALVCSFFLVGLESIIRVLTLALPTFVLVLFQKTARRIFYKFTSPAQKKAEERKRSIHTAIRDASDFVDLCSLFGYSAEEHVVQTRDGFLLGVHRLAWRIGEEDAKVNSGPGSKKKPVVYLHHGLLMNSEVWVCLTDVKRCLPFVLVERGFDVWLGNNRGNKYSKKSVKHSPTSPEFWNFSIDEFALIDIPDTIGYILETTAQSSLSYIGFSQGTAQAFASLAVHPKLNEQVNVFIALAPAMSPPGVSNAIVHAMVTASPQVLFLLFGRRSILSSATMWQNILHPPLFVRVIDMGLGFLFNWKAKNMALSQKLAAYPHLYSFTSTKSVVHWFQIIRNRCFQMYDDDVQSPLQLGTSSKYTKVAKYPTRNIRTPVVLVYGGSDSLVDIRVMLKELPARTVATEIPHYEHLDFLWARDVDDQVFRHVFDALESFNGAEHSQEQFESYGRARHVSLSTSNSMRQDPIESDTASVVSAYGETSRGHKAREDAVEPSTPNSDYLASRMRKPRAHFDPSIEDKESSTPETPSYAAALDGTPDSSGTATHSQPTTSNGSGDSTAVTTATTTTPRRSPAPIRRRRDSTGSNISIDSMKDGRGIRIGAARPSSGVVNTSSPSLAGHNASSNGNGTTPTTPTATTGSSDENTKQSLNNRRKSSAARLNLKR